MKITLIYIYLNEIIEKDKEASAHLKDYLKNQKNDWLNVD